MLQQTQEFERQQASVHKRLMIVTSSDTPEEATRRLRGPLEKLRKLQLAERYIDMLEYIESLKDSARGCLPQNPKEALKPYTQLKELAIQLQALQEPAVSLARQYPNFSPMALSKNASTFGTIRSSIISGLLVELSRNVPASQHNVYAAMSDYVMILGRSSRSSYNIRPENFHWPVGGNEKDHVG
jgi:hypothetical protein